MKNQITKAKAKLMLEHPYFGMVATNLTINDNTNIAAVNFKGDILEINSEYLEVLTTDEVCTILANASLKQQLFHSQRGRGKISYLWDVASDFAINDLLAQNGFTIPPLLNYSSRFERLYAEEIYKILLSESNINEDESQEDVKLIEDLDYDIFIEQVINKMQKSGELPLGIERFVKNLKSSKLSWRELLFNYIQNHAKIDYSFNPPNKRFLHLGIALPSIRGEMLKLAIAIDTSGSIDDNKLESFLSEVEFIMQSFQNYEITLIECDSKIHNIQTLTPQEPIKPTLKGGGGTDFREVFKYLKDNIDANILIYFSDGEGIFPKEEPNFDTIWALTKDNEVPFGTKIILQ